MDRRIFTHRPHSSSFWGFICRILLGNPKKELLAQSIAAKGCGEESGFLLGDLEMKHASQSGGRAN